MSDAATVCMDTAELGYHRRQFASSQAGVSILDRILMLVEITFDPNDVDAEADDIESSIFSPACVPLPS